MVGVVAVVVVLDGVDNTHTTPGMYTLSGDTAACSQTWPFPLHLQSLPLLLLLHHHTMQPDYQHVQNSNCDVRSIIPC